MTRPALEAPLAIADDFGPAVVPSLSSYVARDLEWEAEALPPGYDMGATTREFLPFYRSGAAFIAGSDASMSANGSVLLADGTPLALMAGTVRPADGRDMKPVETFTNRAGVFVAQGLQPGLYFLEFATTPPTIFRFRIDKNATSPVDVGDLFPRKE